MVSSLLTEDIGRLSAVLFIMLLLTFHHLMSCVISCISCQLLWTQTVICLSLFQGLCAVYHASWYNWSNERTHSERLFSFSRKTGFSTWSNWRFSTFFGCFINADSVKKHFLQLLSSDSTPSMRVAALRTLSYVLKTLGEVHLLLKHIFTTIDFSFQYLSSSLSMLIVWFIANRLYNVKFNHRFHMNSSKFLMTQFLQRFPIIRHW